jgi:hypothetical protein
MSDSAATSGQPDDAGYWADRLSALRTRVRRDRRATSIPLLLLGAATTTGTAVGLASSSGSPDGYWGTVPALPLFGGLLTPGGSSDQLTGWLMTAAFVAIWVTFRVRAARAGLGQGAGFGIAAGLGLFLLLSFAGSFVMVYTGPFVIFAAGLLAAAAWQRNRLLAAWAVAAGGLGVFEGFFGITNRIPYALWAMWEHPLIYLALGAATLLAGIVAWMAEGRAR